MPKYEAVLGDEVKDTITGFQGIVVCISQWYHGCKRVTVQSQVMKDGKPVEPVTFDEPQLILVESKQHKPQNKTGGPRPEPTRR